MTTSQRTLPEDATPAINAEFEKKVNVELNQFERLCQEYLQTAKKMGGSQPKYQAVIKKLENIVKEIALIRKPK